MELDPLKYKYLQTEEQYLSKCITLLSSNEMKDYNTQIVRSQLCTF